MKKRFWWIVTDVKKDFRSWVFQIFFLIFTLKIGKDVFNLTPIF